MKKATLVLLVAVSFLGFEAKGSASTMPPTPICKNGLVSTKQPCRAPKPLPPQPVRKGR